MDMDAIQLIDLANQPINVGNLHLRQSPNKVDDVCFRAGWEQFGLTDPLGTKGAEFI